MATNSPIVDELARKAVVNLFREKGRFFKFPFDLIWEFLPDHAEIDSVLRSPQANKLISAGYIKKTGGLTKTVSASRRGNDGAEYTFGVHFGSAESVDDEMVVEASKAFVQSFFCVATPLLVRFASALISKKFLLLTGMSGSGKTKLAEAFAMWLCESGDQYRVVAVGADWTSNENLLGYADALRDGAYQLPSNGVLELIIKSSSDKEKPYFLILDEMNLSHVERYFADFLSAMESSNSKLRLHGMGAGLMAGTTPVPHELALPNNLFIIGTVNVDETTYMFSPKVLDRANVIEFRATLDQMAVFLDDPAGINLKALEHQGAAFAQAFVQRSNADADIATLVDAAGAPYGLQLKADLLVLFTALADMGAEFGFRTAKEIARFMVIHKELSGTGWLYKDALDAQVLQKLMPKLHGSARKLDGVLQKLGEFAVEKDLPLTREKVKRMQDRLKRDGFTSFAEA